MKESSSQLLEFHINQTPISLDKSPEMKKLHKKNKVSIHCSSYKMYR